MLKSKTMDFAVNSDSLFSLKHGKQFAAPKCLLKRVATIVEYQEVIETEVKKKNIFEQIAQIMFLNTAGHGGFCKKMLI